ncbi:MAG TPA: aromatic ring-hydroxylating dioxygenase subunit alpha [Stellaceae bacterium]|nr:aromatic ring-hydroxylating dioxygenase subunit alpha [Stellaceae bacterium]
MISLPKRADERWTDRLGMGHGPISLEDTISPEFFELEKEAVFRRSWLFIGRVQQVPRPGDYFTKEIEVLKASLLVVRDKEMGVRVYHNVCPHRGNKLVWDTHAETEQAGRCTMFVCKFHGLGFGTNGDVAKLTDPKAWLDNQGKALHLAEVRFELWHGFIFVNLERGGPSRTLREFLGEHFWSGFDGFAFEDMTERFSARANAKANWKTMIDGFGEVYHAATTHALPFPAAAEMVSAGASFTGDYYGTHGQHRQYVMAGYPSDFYQFDYERITQAFGTGPRHPFAKDYMNLPDGANPTQVKNWGTSSNMFFPNFYLQLYAPGWIVTYAMWPLAYNRMRFEIEMWMPPSRNFSEMLSHKSGISMFLEAALQDFSLLEAQQAGLETRAFDTYPLTDEEVCVRHFHQEIYAAVDKYKQEVAHS